MLSSCAPTGCGVALVALCRRRVPTFHGPVSMAGRRCAWRLNRGNPVARDETRRGAERCSCVSRPICDAAHSDSVHSAPTSYALKEWATVVAALGTGDQTVLLRKGGIKVRRGPSTYVNLVVRNTGRLQEKTFVPKASRFAMFRTAFHLSEGMLTPMAAAKYADDSAYRTPLTGEAFEVHVLGECVEAWMLPSGIDAEAIWATLEGQHVWGPGFLDTRLKYKAGDNLTLMLIRAYNLSAPLRVTMDDAMGGCTSWITVPVPPQIWATAVPALSDAAFNNRRAVLNGRLSLLPGVKPLTLPA